MKPKPSPALFKILWIKNLRQMKRMSLHRFADKRGYSLEQAEAAIKEHDDATPRDEQSN